MNRDENCIFCKIIAGEIPSHKVYEDEHSFAFLDIHPVRPGHVLVIPKHHEPEFYNLPEEAYLSAMSTAKLLAPKVKEVTKPIRVGMIIAGFDVPHTHIHLIPMHDFHDITSKPKLDDGDTNPPAEELADMADKIKSALS